MESNSATKTVAHEKRAVKPRGLGLRPTYSAAPAFALAPPVPVAANSIAEIDDAMRLQLALAVAKPDSLAMLIEGPNERFGELLPIEAALGAMRFDSPDEKGARSTLTIDPDDVFIPIDGDDPSRQAQLDMWLERVRELGLKPVVQASGRPGHKHAWVRVDDAALRARLIAFAKELKLGVRVGQRMRPLLAPHRDGLRVHLIEPTDPAEALSWLSPTAPAASRKQRSGRLSHEMERLLVEGDDGTLYLHDDGGCDRSRMLMAIVCCAVANGVDRDDLFGRLLANAGGARLQRKRSGGARTLAAARRDYDATWANAERFVTNNPVVGRGPSIEPEIRQIRLAAQLLIRGRESTTDRAVLDAVLDVAALFNQMAIGLGVLTIAEMTGIKPETISKSLHRLRARWIERTSLGHGRIASTYRLHPPPVVSPLVNERTFKDSNDSAAPVAVRGESVNLPAVRRRPLFARGLSGVKGLGLHALQVLEAVHRGQPATMRVVAKDPLVSVSRATTYRWVVELKKLKLVVEVDGMLSTPADLADRLDALEREKKLDVAANEQRERYREQRVEYHAELEKQRDGYRTAWRDERGRERREKQARIDAALRERDEMDIVWLRGRRYGDDQRLVEGRVAPTGSTRW